MLALLKRYRELLLIAVLLVLPLGVYFAHARRPSERSWVDRAVVTVTGPVEKAIGWAVTGVTRGWYGYIALRHARDRAFDLSRQLNELKIERQQLMAMKDENVRLRALLSVSEAAPERKYLGARVIGVRLDPKGLQIVIIDKGSGDGVTKMMPVVIADGAVGRVNAVYPGMSEVLVLVDRNSSIAVLVERTRARANVRGLDKPDLCTLDYVRRNEDVVEGDLVVTSGTDGVFPRGIPVGKITNVERAGNGLYHVGRVVPAVDVTKLEEVLIITSVERPPEASFSTTVR